MRKVFAVILLLVLLVSLIPGVSAEVTHNFTPVFNSDDFAHYNVSYQLNATQSTPWWIWLFFVATGFGCLFASFILKPSQRNDYFAYIAPLPILISALIATGFSGIEVVTGYGAGSEVAVVKASGEIQAHEYVMMTGHTIYVNDVLAMFLGIMFIIALLNCFRVYEQQQRSMLIGDKNDRE